MGGLLRIEGVTVATVPCSLAGGLCLVAYRIACAVALRVAHIVPWLLVFHILGVCMALGYVVACLVTLQKVRPNNRGDCWASEGVQHVRVKTITA